MKKTSKNALGFIAMVGVLGMVWLGVMWPKVPYSIGQEASWANGKPEMGRAKTVVSSISEKTVGSINSSSEPALEDTNEAAYILDRSPLNNAVLLSRQAAKEPDDAARSQSPGDLWLQDENREERLVAHGVVMAKFSPDGRKIAYSNRNGELFVETLDGQELASIPRAFDPSWCSDSASISFLAIPSLDYPELQQRSIYDLRSGEVAQTVGR